MLRLHTILNEARMSHAVFMLLGQAPDWRALRQDALRAARAVKWPRPLIGYSPVASSPSPAQAAATETTAAPAAETLTGNGPSDPNRVLVSIPQVASTGSSTASTALADTNKLGPE